MGDVTETADTCCSILRYLCVCWDVNKVLLRLQSEPLMPLEAQRGQGVVEHRKRILIRCLVSHRVISYECCPGYEKIPGKRGCPAGRSSIKHTEEPGDHMKYLQS